MKFRSDRDLESVEDRNLSKPKLLSIETIGFLLKLKCSAFRSSGAACV